MNGFFNLLCLCFSGVIASALSIPLLKGLFGVTLTITGTGLIGGMYLYMLASILVLTGLWLIYWGLILLMCAIGAKIK